MHRRKTHGTASVLLKERSYPTNSRSRRSSAAAAPWSYCLVALAVVAALVLFVVACRTAPKNISMR